MESVSVSDAQIRDTIRQTNAEFDYVICPHTAAGEWVRRNLYSNKPGIVVSTAHPAKFETVVEPEIGRTITVPQSLRQMLDAVGRFEKIDTDMNRLF